MIENITTLKVKSGDFEFKFEVAQNAPIGACYDALCKMVAFCIQKMQEAQPKQPEEPKNESVASPVAAEVNNPNVVPLTQE